MAYKNTLKNDKKYKISDNKETISTDITNINPDYSKLYKELLNNNNVISHLDSLKSQFSCIKNNKTGIYITENNNNRLLAVNKKYSKNI